MTLRFLCAILFLMLLKPIISSGETSSTPTVTIPPPAPPATGTIPKPIMQNACDYQFTCMCGQGSVQKNCGTGGCTCGQLPLPDACEAATGSWTTVYCQGGGSCIGGSMCTSTANPPNSFTPPLQRGQCRIKFERRWGVTYVNSRCSPGYVCPDASNITTLPPALSCPLGVTYPPNTGNVTPPPTLSVGCVRS